MSSVDITPEERAKIVAERADVKYGPFASLHEAYGVLSEEVHEMSIATLHYNDCNDPNFDMPEFLFVVQRNDQLEFVELAKELSKMHKLRIDKMNDMIAECIDVIAVCDRIIAQWGDKADG